MLACLQRQSQFDLAGVLFARNVLPAAGDRTRRELAPWYQQRSWRRAGTRQAKEREQQCECEVVLLGGGGTAQSAAGGRQRGRGRRQRDGRER